MTPEHNRQICEKLEPLLEDYVNGELPRGEAERLTEHLDACGNCRAALDDARIAARLASAFEPAADPGAGFARIVMARIDVAERWIKEQGSFWRPFETLAWRVAFSAVLALVFLFAYGLRTTGVAAPPESSAILVPQTDTFVRAASFSPSPSNSSEVLMAIAERHHGQR